MLWSYWIAIFPGRLEYNALFFLIKHIPRVVCSSRGRITQPRMWYMSSSRVLHYSVFLKATTGVLLRPTLLPAAMNHSSLRELPAPNRLRLILPYLILPGALFERNPVKIYHYFVPKVNVAFERHVFRQMEQQSHEKVDKCVCRQRQKAITCDLPNVDETIGDQLIEKCRDGRLRR